MSAWKGKSDRKSEHGDSKAWRIIDSLLCNSTQVGLCM